MCMRVPPAGSDGKRAGSTPACLFRKRADIPRFQIYPAQARVESTKNSHSIFIVGKGLRRLPESS